MKSNDFGLDASNVSLQLKKAIQKASNTYEPMTNFVNRVDDKLLTESIQPSSGSKGDLEEL